MILEEFSPFDINIGGICLEIGQRQFIENVCNSFDTPVVLLDGNLRCIYCNREGFFEKGKLLATVLLTEIKVPIIKESSKAMASMNGIKYSIRLIPFCDEFYFCEFFDLQEVYELAEYSDCYEKVKMYTKSMDQNINDLWKKSNELENYQRKINDEGLFDRILSFKKALNSLNSDIYSLSSFVSMLFHKQDPKPLCVNKMLKELIDRCNSLLYNCGRAIDFEYEIKEYYILSNERHALVAVINALQNALLYSSADSIPTVVLSSVLEKDKRYVVLKVINDGIYFVNEENGDKIDRNFVFQRIGLGIPIIKSFVKECDGVFSMEDKDNKVVLEIKIPQYIPHNISECILESPGRAAYKTGIPDLIEIKMNDVVNFFGKKNP